MDFGLSFNPVGEDPQQQGQAPQGSQTPIQDAIKTLSLRIPNFRTQGSLAPLPLLQSQGSLGMQPGGSPLEQMLMRLFGAQGPMSPQQMPSGTSGGIPPPVIRPGGGSPIQPPPGSTPPPIGQTPPAPSPRAQRGGDSPTTQGFNFFGR